MARGKYQMALLEVHRYLTEPAQTRPSMNGRHVPVAEPTHPRDADSEPWLAPTFKSRSLPSVCCIASLPSQASQCGATTRTKARARRTRERPEPREYIDETCMSFSDLDFFFRFDPFPSVRPLARCPLETQKVVLQRYPSRYLPTLPTLPAPYEASPKQDRWDT